MTDETRGRDFSRLIAIELAAEAKRRGIRQKDLAVAAGVTPVHFSHAVNGRKGALTVAVVLHAAEHLGVDPHLIVQRAYDSLSTSVAAPAPEVALGGGRGPAGGNDTRSSRVHSGRPRSGVRGGGHTRGEHS